MTAHERPRHKPPPADYSPDASHCIGGTANVQGEEAVSEWAKNAAAFMSLAITQRRLAHQYRRLATESAEHGDGYQYRQYVAEARRLWRDAKGHLSLARHHRELGTRHG